MNASPTTPLDLWQLIIAKDHTALNTMRSLYADSLYGFISNILEGEDVRLRALDSTMQEIWLTAEHYTPESEKIITWMLKVARRHAVNGLRNQLAIPHGYIYGNVKDCKYLNLLSPEQHIVFASIYYFGNSMEDIVSRLKIDQNEVHVLLREAMSLIRNYNKRLPS